WSSQNSCSPPSSWVHKRNRPLFARLWGKKPRLGTDLRDNAEIQAARILIKCPAGRIPRPASTKRLLLVSLFGRRLGEALVRGKGVDWPTLGLQSFRWEVRVPMSRTLILIGGVVILLSATQPAWAFSTRQVDPMTTSDGLSDPDELANKMSSGQSG